MNRSIFRAIGLSVLCASFVGMTAVSAFAQGHRREVRAAKADIAALKPMRDRAASHKNWAKVKRLDAQIAADRDVIRRWGH